MAKTPSKRPPNPLLDELGDALEIEKKRFKAETDVPPLEDAEVLPTPKNVKTGARRGGGHKRARG